MGAFVTKNGQAEEKVEGPNGESKTRVVYDSLEKYIPAPMIGTFIAINAFVPYGELDSFFPSFDRWIMLLVAAILSVVMFAYLRWSGAFSSQKMRILLSVSIFFWCLMIAEQRFSGISWWPIISIVAFLYVALFLLILTLFELGN